MARYLHTATLLAAGSVLVAGGDGGQGLASAELYIPAFGTWSRAPSMTSIRKNHAATLLSNGHVLMTGGWDGSSTSSTAELYR